MNGMSPMIRITFKGWIFFPPHQMNSFLWLVCCALFRLFRLIQFQKSLIDNLLYRSFGWCLSLLNQLFQHLPNN